MSSRLLSYTGLALLFAISATAPLAAHAEENSRDFTLINNSDVDVVNLWSSPTNVKTWEEAFANVNVPATSQQEMKFAEPNIASTSSRSRALRRLQDYVRGQGGS